MLFSRICHRFWSAALHRTRFTACKIISDEKQCLKGETCIDWTIFYFLFKDLLSNLLLKKAVYCITGQPSIIWFRRSVLNVKFSVFTSLRPTLHKFLRLHFWPSRSILMNIYFLPTSSKILPTFRHFAQLGSILHSWKFILPAFKFRPGKGVFWGGFWGVLCTSPKGVCDGWVKNWGWGWYSGQSDTLSGQIWAICTKKWAKCSRIGK